MHSALHNVCKPVVENYKKICIQSVSYKYLVQLICYLKLHLNFE